MNSIQVVKSMDASYNYNNQVNKFAIKLDSNNLNVTDYAATDASYQSVQINLTPINSLILNQLLFSYKYRLKVTGTAGAGATNLLEPGYFAISPSIFTECTNAILTIDSASTTVQTNRIIPALLPYRDVNDRAFQTQFIGGAPDFVSYTGSSYQSTNPLSDNYMYECDGQDMYGFQRYLNDYWSIISNSPTETILEINGLVRIPTGISQYMTDNKEFFLGTKNMSLNLNFNDLARTFKYMLAAVGSPTITNVQVVDGSGTASNAFIEKPSLRIYTCDYPIPPEKDIYYNSATNYIANSQTFVQTLSPGASATLSLNNININNIPNNMYLMVRDLDQTNYKTGNGIAIDSIDVRTDNTALSVFKYNNFDWYQIAKKNNYQFDYHTFKNNSVLFIPMTMLIDNNQFYSSASGQNLNFTINVTVRNPSTGQLINNLEALLVFQYDGIMVTSLSQGTKTLMYNFVDVNSWLSSPVMWSDTCVAKRSRKQINGGWLGALISAVPSVISGISAVANIAKPIAQKLICENAPINQSGQPSGAGLVTTSGGAVLSRNSLRKKLY